MIKVCLLQALLSIYSPFSDMVVLPLHNIPCHFFISSCHICLLCRYLVLPHMLPYFSNHVFIGLLTAFNSDRHTLFHPVLLTFPHRMFIPSQPTTSDDRCDRLNSYQLSQSFTTLVLRLLLETPHIHLIIFMSTLSNFNSA